MSGVTLLVVAGIVVREGRLLLARRPLGTPHGGLWEFPGGKVEPGEIPEDALAREWGEELSVRIAGARPFSFVTGPYPGGHLTLLFFEIGALTLEPRPSPGSAVRWCEAQEARLLAMPPADARIRELLLPHGRTRFLDTELEDREALLATAGELDPYVFGSEDLGPGEVLRFRKRNLLGRSSLDGILVRTPEGVHAYENLCPHVPIPLDRGEEMLTDEAQRIVCRSHGAVFLSESGYCISGPCGGESLTRLPLEPRGAGHALAIRKPAP